MTTPDLGSTKDWAAPEGGAGTTAWSPHDWVRHAVFVRALARRLAMSAGERDDLAQETLLSVWRRGVQRLRDVRGFMGRVAVNTARMQRRADRRRSQREATRAAPADAVAPAAADVAGALEAQRRVAASVAALPAAYQRVVYLHFYAGWPPRRIAAELAVPVETVRTRLRRALERVRQDLDREGQAWRGALLATCSLGGPAASAATVVAGGIMKTKGWLVAGLLILALGAGAKWTLEREPDACAAADPPPALEAGLPPRPEPVPAPHRDAVRSEAAPVEPAVEHPVAPAANTIDLAGTVVVEPAAGGELASTSGSFELAYLAGTQLQTLTVEVTAGRFQVRVAADAPLRVRAMVLDGRPAFVDDKGLQVPSQGPLELRARWLEGALLHVVAADTGLPLAPVEVRARRVWRAFGDDLHPGDHGNVEEVARGVPSPVLLPPARGRVVYWARAAGYGWGRIVVVHDRAGERTVVLHRGCRLTVRTAGDPLPEGAFLRLYPGGEAASSEAPSSLPFGVAPAFVMEPRVGYAFALQVHAAPSPAPATVVEDMPAGRYLACVEVGEFDAARRLGEAPVQLTAGLEAAVTVPLRDVVPPTAGLRGRLVVPAALDEMQFDLVLTRVREGQEGGQDDIRLHRAQLRPIEDDRVERGASGSAPGGGGAKRGDGRAYTFAFDAGRVLAGEYYAYVTVVQHRQRFTVGPRDTEIDIEVPPIAELHARVVDARSGAPLAPRRASWSDGALDGLRENRRMSARVDHGEVSFVSVVGAVEVGLEHPDYEPLDVTVELVPGDNRCEWRMQPARGLVVTLRSQGSVVPMPVQWFGDLRCVPLDGAEFPTRTSSDSKAVRLYMPGSGRYRLEAPPVAGFAPIEPREVEVTDGMREVVFDLGPGR
ncbi:MAG: RNA polymerase sigma factor [Planctomycetota bacterium]